MYNRPVRLSFEELLALHAALDDRFARAELSLGAYLAEWDGLLELAGWDDEGYAAALADRWDGPDVATRRFLFVC